MTFVCLHGDRIVATRGVHHREERDARYASQVVSDRLSNRTLRHLPSGIRQPGYHRQSVAAGIVHLGVGAFHRAHQAVYIDDCLGAGEPDWAVVGASLRSPDTRDALAPQDGLYTLSVKDGDREDLRVVGSIVSTLVAPEEPAALLAAMIDPAVRIVTSTVTEKAYMRDAGGDLDLDHPDVRWDLENPGRPKTVHGFLAAALAGRRQAGSKPFTVLCCDNLPANGATLRRLLLRFLEAGQPDLAAYVEDSVPFPSTMVDRIVPATTDADRARISMMLGVEDAWPVTTEPFCQWVVEDDFVDGRPDWERFGVEMVRDVRPFEDMKLRLLNGSHSAIAYLGLLAGHQTVAESFGDPVIRNFVAGLWGEAIPTLPARAGLDAGAYTRKLTARYDNTALRHRTAQIATDGSQKLPQRIIATAIEQGRGGGKIDHLALVPAAWIAACEARASNPATFAFTDPLDTELRKIVALRQPASTTVSQVFDAAGFAKGSASRQALIARTAGHLEALRSQGLAAALAGISA